MSTRFKGFALLAILVCAIGVMPVFASPYALLNPTGTLNSTNANATSGNTNSSSIGVATGAISGAITVTTDKTSYNNGDKVTISGTTQQQLSGTPVNYILKSPIGNIVKIDQLNVASDNSYSTTIMAKGPLWQAPGTYTITVYYGGTTRTATATFQFTGGAASTQAQTPTTMSVDNTQLSVQYSITNGKVLDIKADVPSKSLIVSIQTTGDGVLTITLPRGLIDAKTSGGQDDVFYVLNDGQEANFQQTSTATDRTLTISFTNGTSQIEIIGTQIIPEFGPIAALVLAIAIISIIAVSAKTGLRFMPKY